MKNKRINNKIIKIWNKYFEGDKEVYAPLFYDTFAKNSVLFIGMNPSFSASGFKTIFKDSPYSNVDPKKFFKWSNVSTQSEHIDQCIEMDKHAYTNYSLYFSRPIEIAEKVGLPWDHIDLFLYRETSQTNFMKRIHEGKQLNQFALDQLAIFKETMHSINPKCVVVSNAFGSQILRDYLKEDLIWDEKKGFHWYIGNGDKVPMFFTSMLSGQRSLDRWSYERLVWHVKQAIKQTI